MAESAVKDVEETICKNALRELYEAMENPCDAIGEAMALIDDAFFQAVRPVLDSIMNLMPPLLADFTHTRVCKPFCERTLTLPKHIPL